MAGPCAVPVPRGIRDLQWPVSGLGDELPVSGPEDQVEHVRVFVSVGAAEVQGRLDHLRRIGSVSEDRVSRAAEEIGLGLRNPGHAVRAMGEDGVVDRLPDSVRLLEPEQHLVGPRDGTSQRRLHVQVAETHSVELEARRVRVALEMSSDDALQAVVRLLVVRGRALEPPAIRAEAHLVEILDTLRAAMHPFGIAEVLGKDQDAVDLVRLAVEHLPAEVELKLHVSHEHALDRGQRSRLLHDAGPVDQVVRVQQRHAVVDVEEHP